MIAALVIYIVTFLLVDRFSRLFKAEALEHVGRLIAELRHSLNLVLKRTEILSSEQFTVLLPEETLEERSTVVFDILVKLLERENLSREHFMQLVRVEALRNNDFYRFMEFYEKCLNESNSLDP